MILSVTPNPSVDATLELPSVDLGGVNRASASRREAGGKGINVARACASFGHDVLALAPCSASDPFAALCRASTIPLLPVPIGGTVRTNITVSEAGGRTTKFNESGPRLSPEEVTRLSTQVRESALANRPDVVVLAGSLPPGSPRSWYTDLTRAVHDAWPQACVAVDTSDDPLRYVGAHLREAAPDILSPNAFELGQLAGVPGAELESSAAAGEYSRVVDAARSLLNGGVREVLVTLGPAGACLVTGAGAWAATPPPVTARSTVGAGDAALAGYVMARVDGLPPDERLRRSVALGSAAAATRGSATPAADEVDYARTSVVTLA